MNIKKLVLACAAISLLYGGDAYAAKTKKPTNNKVSKLAQKFGGQAKAYQQPNTSRGPNSTRSKNAKRNARIKALTLLNKTREAQLEGFTPDIFSNGTEETFEDVGNEFGTHIQAVWNLDSAKVAKTAEIETLFNDLKYTATAVSLNGEQPDEESADANFDFSEIDEMDFQGIIAEYDGSKAFYLNALAKIAYTLQQGTKGHVFWHGMFKIMVKLLIADHYGF